MLTYKAMYKFLEEGVHARRVGFQVGLAFGAGLAHLQLSSAEEADPSQVRAQFSSGAAYLHSIAELGGFLLE